ncbi:MAG: tRNA (N6-isopentenyl adenosine(37)-C2)-methylthiotransferase MiaB [Actinobacteria bacterium]|nr:MAG: tRNA (N6-isopentenyl adenosine(37)-C2)-methylthiotransferase MiaB [Actinomycetota bacterium]
MKAYIKTFGCQMNENDSERIMYLLEEEGYERTYDIAASDLIVLNTCTVREKAKNRLYGHIGNLKRLKSKNKDILICIGGCTAQSMKEKIIEDFPFVDIVFGTHNIPEFPELIKKSILTNRSICSIKDNGFDPDLFKVKREYNFKAFVPITIGCNNYCSYCIVPFVRGREKSVEVKKIIRNIEGLVSRGVIEVTLLGQNVNSYGKDLNEGCTFSELLEKVSDIKRLKRIRFITSHPKDFSRSIIDIIKNRDNLVKHIHLPLQAGSNKVLKEMNRNYTREDYLNIIENIREEIPDCSITTDIIVGFPGEERYDFLETLDMVRKVRFNRAFTFIYSPREGTKASKIKDHILLEEKKKWFKELLETQNRISDEENKKFIGKKFKVLVEGKSVKDGNLLEGRMENNTIVNFKGNTGLIGKIVSVIITRAKTFYLMGDLARKNYV